MTKFFYYVAILFAFVACTKSSDDGTNDNPTSKPDKPKEEITLSTTSSNFTTEGGESKITFTTNEAWTAEVINTRADGWCTVNPTSGAAGNATITISTEPNDTPDDRTATIKIKAGTASKTIAVSQKQKDALTVTSSKFEVGAEGGEVKIEVKANIDFEYAIDESAKDWIKYEGTRAMKTSTLTFSIAENDDTEKREGKIAIKNGEFNEVVTIYQAGDEPTIVISQNEYVVSSDGETIAVEVTSNVDVAVELPTDVDWISESTTRATSTNTYYFDIQPNEDYDQRTAEIKFTNKESGLSEIVKVVQTQKDALVVAKDSYTVNSEGDLIEIEVGHNVDFDIEIANDWITKVETRAFVTETLVFNIAKNPTNDNREGTIIFKSKDGSLEQIVKVYQQMEDTIIVSAKEIILEPEAGTFTVEIQANVEFRASTNLVNWIRQVEPTRGMTSHTLYYEYDVNPTSEAREAYIFITTDSKEEVITVIQKGAEINEDNYVLLGTGQWTDDIVAPLFGLNASTYDVEVYENPDKPGFIYLKDLYTNAYAGVLEVSFGIDASSIPTWETSYFAIDVSDPTAVNIPNQSIGLNLGYGEMSIWNLEPGTMDNGVISFPTKGLAINLPDEGAFYANKSGLTKLNMPESEIPKDEYILLGTGRWTDDIVAPLFGLEASTYEVEVYENPTTPGFIYLKDLYTNAYAGVLENSYGIDTSKIPTWETSYFAIDVSDPTAVNISYQSIGLDLGYGEMYTWSLESGTYENGVISFPTKGLAIQDDDGAYYANRSGLTKLDMNEEETPDPGEDEEDTYKLLGTGYWTDDIVAPLFGIATETYEVEVYENPTTPGFIYLKDLYTNAYAGVLENSYGIDASKIPTWETSYFAIDVTNPAAVNIFYQSIGLDLGYGNMDIFSIETGKLEDGILTFPTDGLAINLPKKGAYYANRSGKTRLVMPGYSNNLYESTDYSKDGEVKVLQKATKGKGIDIVLMGDAYSDRQIADGSYDNVMNIAMEKFFMEEPYKSYRDHFNVYSVGAVSKNEGYLTGMEETCFAGYFGSDTHVGGNDSRVFSYAEKAIGEERIDDALIVVMMNSEVYAGTCYMYYPSDNDNWGDGVSISYFPVGKDDVALAQVLHHEAGGHGFSKLDDEYAYESMGSITAEEITRAKSLNKYGWFKNIDFTNDPTKIKWRHFLSDERYANDGLGVFEGGSTYWTGVWRPTYNSIMRHNNDGFNAPSREAIYYRIHKLAYGADWEYDYEEFVEYDARNRKATSNTIVPYRLDTPVDFKPLHRPIVVNSTWREAKKYTLRMDAKSLTLSEQAKSLTEQAIANALTNAKTGAIRKDGKLQKVAATPYKRPKAVTSQNNKLEIKGNKITSPRM